jgi:hydrogenase expression/formation protein HypE
VVAADQADAAVQALRALPKGEQADVIDHIDNTTKHVVLHTELGGQRILEELEDDPLPRIC